MGVLMSVGSLCYELAVLNVDQNQEHLERSFTDGENVNGRATLENTWVLSIKKLLKTKVKYTPTI